MTKSVVECLQPLNDSRLLEWLRIEIFIFYARIASMVIFIVLYLSFKKKKTTVRLGIDDLQLRTRLVDSEEYWVTIVDEDEDDALDALELGWKEEEEGAQVDRKVRLGLKDILDLLG